MSDEHELEDESLWIQNEALREAIQEYVAECAGGEGAVISRFVVVAEIAYPDESFVRMLEITSDQMPAWVKQGLLFSALYDSTDE